MTSPTRTMFVAMIAVSLGALSAMAADDKYVVVVQDYQALPPYSAYQNNEYTGFNRELLDLFAAKHGYEFEYVAYPVKRLFFEFVNGVGDLKYPDNPQWATTVKKDAPITYSEPVVEYINGVMVRPEDKATGVEAIEKLGLVAGWTPLRYEDHVAAGDIELVENNSYDGSLKQTILGRTDGAYSNIASSQYYLKNIMNQPGALVFDETLPHVRSARMLSSIKHPEMIAEFNAFLVTSAAEVQALKEMHAVEDGIAAF